MKQLTIAVWTNKGGVGKTTLAVNIAAELASRGVSTLLLDMDPQGDSTNHLTRQLPARFVSVAEVLAGTAGVAEAVLAVAGNLYLVPADARATRLDGDSGRVKALAAALAGPGMSRFQAIVADCPPSYGALTRASIHALKRVLTPVDLEWFSFRRLPDVLQMVTEAGGRVGDIVAIRPSARRSLAQQVLADLRQTYPGLVRDTIIRTNVKVTEASALAQPVASYAPRSAVVNDFRSLVSEMFSNE